MSPFLPPPRPTKDCPPSLDKMEADLRGILKQYTTGQVVPTVVGHLQHLPRSMQLLWQTQLSITLQTPNGLDGKLPLPQEMTPWVPLAGQGETGVQFSVCCAEPVPAAAVPTAAARAHGAIRLVRKQPIQLEAHLPTLSSALPSMIVFGENITMQRPASKLKRKDPSTEGEKTQDEGYNFLKKNHISRDFPCQRFIKSILLGRILPCRIFLKTGIFQKFFRKITLNGIYRPIVMQHLHCRCCTMTCWRLHNRTTIQRLSNWCILHLADSILTGDKCNKEL